MKKLLILLIAALLVVPTPCSYAGAGVNSPQSDDSITTDNENRTCAPNRFIVKLKDFDACAQTVLEQKKKFADVGGQQYASLDTLNAKHHIKKARRLFYKKKGATRTELQQTQKIRHEKAKKIRALKGKKNADTPLPDLTNVYLMEVDAGADIESMVKDYTDDPNVEYAQPDYVEDATMIPNDPSYLTLWGMGMIDADYAWDTTMGDGVVVAVVDTGVDYTHPDLAANMWINQNEIANGIDDDNNGYIDDIQGWDFCNDDNDPLDGHSHGTHCAGTIAAIGNNGIGVIGVAPQAKIMALKGLSDAGSGYSSDLAEAVEYAAMNGADVISNSYGPSSRTPRNYVQEQAVLTAHALGCVLVYAAGNENDDVAYYSPKNMKETIAVAASTSTDTSRAYYSNYGSMIDVIAPGSSINSTVLGNSYGYKSGTSMACPHVAGLAALILSQHPEFTNEEVKHVIRTACDEFDAPGFDSESGYGRINANNAVSIHSPLTVTITSPTTYSLINKDNSTTMNVIGSVQGTALTRYSISVKDLHNANADWVTCDGPYTMLVDNNVLGVIDLTQLPEGMFAVKVTATNTIGDTFSDTVEFQAVYDNPAIETVTDDATIQYEPRVTGDYVIWLERETEDADTYLCAYNMVTKTKQVLDSFGPMNPVFIGVACDQNKVAWKATSYTIKVHDLTTGATQQYATSGVGFIGYKMAMSGNYVVMPLYISAAGGFVLHSLNLASGAIAQVVENPINSSYTFDLSNDVLIWKDYISGVSALDHYYRNIVTGETGIFAQDKVGEISNVISGNKIVYVGYDANYNRDLLMFDITTGQTEFLNIPNSPSYPQIDGNRLVWIDADKQISMMNLTTREIEQITVFPARIDTYTGSYVNVDGDRVVWNGDTYGTEDIFCYTYQEPQEAPMLSIPTEITVTVGDSCVFNVSAIDTNGDTLTFTRPVGIDLPTGADFAVNRNEPGYISGIFDWTPSVDACGTYAIPFEVTDGLSKASGTVTIVVKLPNIAPQFSGMPTNFSIYSGTTVLLEIHATDANGDTLTMIPYQALPKGAKFNVGDTGIQPDGTSSITGQLKWTPRSKVATIQTFQFAVKDPVSDYVMSTPISIEIIPAPRKGGGKNNK